MVEANSENGGRFIMSPPFSALFYHRAKRGARGAANEGASKKPRHWRGGEGVREVEETKMLSKEELKPIALEVLNMLKPKQLPVWQVKEVLSYASRMAEWTPMK